MDNMTNKEFIRRAIEINGEKYDFSQTKFIDSKHTVSCICNSCGKTITVKPVQLLAGVGCKECYGITYLTRDSFIARANAIYGENAFDYTRVNYHNYHTPVEIKCNTCGKTFLRKPSMHLGDYKCSYCSSSLGVQRIWDFLDSYGLDYEREKMFDGLVYRRPLRYDFYIPSRNVIIEYHGELHYRSGYGEDTKTQQEKLEKDRIKEKFAKDNGIKMIIIPYTALESWKTTLEMLKRELGLSDHVEEHIDTPDNDIAQSPMDQDHLALNLESHLRQVHDGLDGLGYDIWSCPDDLKIECLQDLLNIEDLVEKLGTKIRKYCRETQL